MIRYDSFKLVGFKCSSRKTVRAYLKKKVTNEMDYFFERGCICTYQDYYIPELSIGNRLYWISMNFKQSIRSND